VRPLLYGLLFGVLVAVSVTDIRERRIPNRIVFPALAVGGVAIVGVSLVEDDPGAIVLAAVGAALYFALLLVPHLINPAGMGFGDVKLGLLMGLFLGWLAPDVAGVISLVFAAVILGMLLAVIVGLIARAGWHGTFPLGPALAAGCVAVVLARDWII
jgi:leader peptidase (prepilin peptidase) / N-methyltransferase